MLAGHLADWGSDSYCASYGASVRVEVFYKVCFECHLLITYEFTKHVCSYSFKNRNMPNIIRVLQVGKTSTKYIAVMILC